MLFVNQPNIKSIFIVLAGQEVNDENHPDWVPSAFPNTPGNNFSDRTPEITTSAIQRHKRAQKRRALGPKFGEHDSFTLLFWPVPTTELAAPFLFQEDESMAMLKEDFLPNIVFNTVIPRLLSF